jgi:hypothetical protein
MRAVLKVCGLTLLLQARTLWRCNDSLFFKVPPFASDALLTMVHLLLENMLHTVCCKLQDSETGSFDLLIRFENPRNRMGRDLDCMADVLMEKMAVPSPDLAPCYFWAFTTISRGRNCLFHYPPEACGKWSAAHFQEGGAL